MLQFASAVGVIMAYEIPAEQVRLIGTTQTPNVLRYLE